MQSAAAACICNLAANINSKEIIATSGALEVLVQVLRSDNQAAAAQAAGALWSLCVDNDMNKQRVADAGAIPHLIALLHAPDTFAQSQVRALTPTLRSSCPFASSLCKDACQ